MNLSSPHIFVDIKSTKLTSGDECGVEGYLGTCDGFQIPENAFGIIRYDPDTNSIRAIPDGSNQGYRLNDVWIYQNRVNRYDTLKGDDLCRRIIACAGSDFDLIDTPDSTLFAARSKNFLGHPTLFLAQITPNSEAELRQKNWGYMRPEGFRFISQLAKQINRQPESEREFVVSIGDIHGGEASTRAAKLNQSEAVSSCISDIGDLNTVKVGIINRDGGSGGVLAVINGMPLGIFADAIMAVISPPHCSSILWHKNSEIKRAVKLLKCNANWLKKYQLVDKVLDTPIDIHDYDHYALSAFFFIKEEFARQLNIVKDRSSAALNKLTRDKIISFGLQKNGATLANRCHRNLYLTFHSELCPSKEIDIVPPINEVDISRLDHNELNRLYYQRDILKLDMNKAYYLCKKDSSAFQKGCGKQVPMEEYIHNYKACPNCGKAEYLHAKDIVSNFLDQRSIVELFSNILPEDLLPPEVLQHEIVDAKERKRLYADVLAMARKKSGSPESLVTGMAKINGFLVGVAVNDFAFLGGSMGVAFGEKFFQLARACITYSIPFLYFSCSGGARMQEGTLALSQMAKTSYATRRLAHHHLPAIAFVLNPTSGGVPAGPLFQFPIIASEKNAMLAFSGPRVVRLAGGILDEEVITTDYQAQEGFITEVVHRKEIKRTISKYLKLFYISNPNYARLCENSDKFFSGLLHCSELP